MLLAQTPLVALKDGLVAMYSTSAEELGYVLISANDLRPHDLHLAMGYKHPSEFTNLLWSY